MRGGQAWTLGSSGPIVPSFMFMFTTLALLLPTYLSETSPWWWYCDPADPNRATQGPFPAEKMMEMHRKGFLGKSVKLVGMDPHLDLRIPPPPLFFRTLG